MDDAAHSSHASIERAAVARAEVAALDSDRARDSDHALISAALTGDSAALSQVWERERRWVAAVLLAHKPREADLEDLLQDVALTLVSKIGDVRDVEGFRPWLRAVAMSLARTRGRRQTVRRQGFMKLVSWARGEMNGSSGSRGGATGAHDGALATRGGDGPTGAFGGRTAASTHAIERGRQLLELSAELPDGYREPLLLKAVQGMSYRQIGRVMGLPETTIETRIARARRMLRERAEQPHAERRSLNELEEGDDRVMVTTGHVTQEGRVQQ